MLLDYLLIVKVKGCLMASLETLGVLSRLRKLPSVWKPFFVKSPSTVLTTGMVYDSFLVALAESFTISICTPLEAVINLLPLCIIGVLRDLFTVLYAETGSNLREQQKQAFLHFVDFLDEYADKRYPFILIILTLILQKVMFSVH